MSGAREGQGAEAQDGRGTEPQEALGALERRYRSLLRVLPKRYREARGEELLSALMEGAGEGLGAGDWNGGGGRDAKGDGPAETVGRVRRWPDAREVLSLVGLAVRVRTGADGVDGEVRSASRLGQVARAVALLGWALLSFDGVNVLMATKGQYHTLFLTPGVMGTDFVTALHWDLPMVYPVVYLLLVLGRWVPARVLAVGLFLFAASGDAGEWNVVDGHLLLVLMPTAATLIAYGPNARRVGRDGYRTAGIALAVIGAAVVGVAASGWLYHDHYGLVWRLWQLLFPVPVSQPLPAYFKAIRAAVVVVAAALAVRSAVWPVAMALVAAGLLAPALEFQLQTGHPADTGLKQVLAIEGGLLAVAASALIRERRAARAGRDGPARAS